jgi:hypothetical protein
MQAANGQAGPKKIDYHLKPKMLGKEFTTSELRIWCNRMTFFWDAQLMDTRVEQVRWANFFDCMHTSLERYYEPKMPRGVGICTARNAGDPLADHRTALSIMQMPRHHGLHPGARRCSALSLLSLLLLLLAQEASRPQRKSKEAREEESN